MTECSKCGDCCEIIHLADGSYGRALRWHNAGRAQPWADAAFILDHWIPVPRDWAASINPDFVWPGRVYAAEYYLCDAWDAETRLCTAHESRPPVCQDFPWYSTPQDTTSYHIESWKRCAFWADVPGGNPWRTLPASFAV